MGVSNEHRGEFPGGPVAGTPCSQCRGPGFHQWSLGVLCAATETWPSQINKYFKKCVQGFGLPDSRV